MHTAEVLLRSSLNMEISTGKLQGPAAVQSSIWGREVDIEDKVNNSPRTISGGARLYQGIEPAASVRLQSLPQAREMVLGDVG